MISGITRDRFKRVIYDTETGEIEEVYETSDRHENSQREENETIIIDVKVIDEEEKEVLESDVKEAQPLYNNKGRLVKSKNKNTTVHKKV